MSPALLIIASGMDTFKLLILSQVILSIQLPFTMIPLLLLTGNKKVMGNYANSKIVQGIGWFFAVIIVGLNLLLLYQTFGGKF
jgi:manganese transport protein